MDSQSSGYPTLPPDPATVAIVEAKQPHKEPKHRDPSKQVDKEEIPSGKVQCCAFDVEEGQEPYHTGSVFLFII